MTFYRNRFLFITSRCFPGASFFNAFHMFDQRIRCFFEDFQLFNCQIIKLFEIVFNGIDDGLTAVACDA